MNPYADRMNRVVDFISDHLDERLLLDDLAEVAGFSPYHFHRIFTAVTGETVQAFTRRLRLEKAAFLLRHGGERPMVEIAHECGFESLPAFSRAFKRHHGMPPSRAPRRGATGAGTEPMFTWDRGRYYVELPETPFEDITISFLDLPPLRVAYVRIVDPIRDRRLADGFDRLMAWARARGIPRDARLFGVSQDDMLITPPEKYRYDFCLEVGPGVEPEGEIGMRVLPANRFATAEIVGGMDVVARVWDDLCVRWLPRSRYEPTYDPAMEIYRRSPEELGWEEWDLLAAIPIRPLRRMNGR